MSNEIKFTEEEVKSINEVRTQSGIIYQRLGQLSSEKKKYNDEIRKSKDELYTQLENLRSNEVDLYKSLNEKYGDGNYDPETNIFTPLSDDNNG